jgi:hypothetical protein
MADVFLELGMGSILLVILGLLLFMGVYLIYRARNTRFHSAILLSLFFFCTAAYYGELVAREAGIPIPFAIEGATIEGFVFTELFFLIKAFFTSYTALFKRLLLFCILLAAVDIIFSIYRDIPKDAVIGRIGWTLANDIQILVLSTWQISIGMTFYLRYRKEITLITAKRRYLLLGMSGLVSVAIVPIDAVGTFLAVFLGVDYDYFLLFIVFLILLFVILNFLIWVKPEQLQPSIPVAMESTAAQASPGAPPNSKKEYRVMDIVNYLGDQISVRVGKSPDAIKGLLVIALERELGPSYFRTVSIDEFKAVLTGTFARDVKDQHIEGIEAILGEITKELDKDPSLLMMTLF